VQVRPLRHFPDFCAADSFRESIMNSVRKTIALACAASVLSFGVAVAQTAPAPDPAVTSPAPAAEAPMASDTMAKKPMKKKMSMKKMSKKKMKKKMM